LWDVILLFYDCGAIMNVRLIQPLFKIHLHGNYHVADDRLFWTCLLCIVALAVIDFRAYKVGTKYQ
jgi:hypothetical protein